MMSKQSVLLTLLMLTSELVCTGELYQFISSVCARVRVGVCVVLFVVLGVTWMQSPAFVSGGIPCHPLQ